MKIALFAGTLRVLPTGGYGAEIVTWDLAQALGAAGHEVTLIAPEGSVAAALWLNRNGVGVTIKPCPLVDQTVRDAYGRDWDAQELQWAMRTARQLTQFDVVHDMSCTAALHDTFCAAFYCKRPHLYTTNGISWLAPRLARHNVAVLSECAQAMARRGAHTWEGTQVHGISDPPLPSTRVTPYGCDLNFYRPSVEQRSDILYVGRPHEHKGTELIPRLARARPDLKFVCAWRADTPDHAEAELQFKRDAVGLSNLKFIELPAGVEHHLVKLDLLQRGAVLLHPAVYTDSGPRTVIEAQAVGTPVVAFRRGGVPESTVDGVTSVLVDLSPEWPAESAKVAAVEGLSKALDQALQLDRARVRQHAEKNLSMEKMVERHVALYQELIAGGRW